MSRADRAFALLLLASAAAAVLFALPLAITLFPGAIQRALHGYDAVAAVCAAALYHIGKGLPPLGALVLALSGTSIALGVLKAVRTIRRTSRALTGHRPIASPVRLVGAARALGMEGWITCFDDPRPLAYCRGFVTPRIWISSGAVRRLRHTELGAVLLHEDAHRRGRDPLRILLGRVLGALFFATPLVRALALRFEVAKELAADRSTVRAQGTTAHLAGALVAMGSAAEGPWISGAAIGAWSLAHARVDQLCGASDDAELPGVSRRCRGLSLTGLAVLLLLTFGQAVRADLVPASIVQALEPRMSPADIHSCPLPTSGFLL